jgi:dipeptidase E
MRLLLTSGGITNPSIRNALEAIVGKPISESIALVVPTAAHALPTDATRTAWRVVAGQFDAPLVEVGWKSIGVLELAALPTIDRDQWLPVLQATDVLLVAGGNPMYLCHWMRESGVAELLPSLHDIVYVGSSAGTLVATPRIGAEFVWWGDGGDATLGLVDFHVFPHLDNPALPLNSMAKAEDWAARMPAPSYAIDDQTAIAVADGVVDVVSEGSWTVLSS